MANPQSFTGVTSKGALTVKETDGNPDVPQVNTIVVSNGTLTNDGGGVVTITTGGAGVDSWAGGTTGLLPSGATTGVVSISGTLVVANGGTGATTLTDGGVLLGSGTGVITATGQPTNGQLLIGSTGADPVLATLASSGATVTITNTAGGINLEASGSTGANPTATVSGSAVNGVATTFMRSDGAPALANTAVTPAAYTSADITVDAQGRITAAASGSGGGTGANPTAEVSGVAVNGVATTFLRSDGAPALADTAVAAGAYTTADITVDAQGRITAAASGSGGGVIVQDEGVPLATTATTLDFVGANVTASGVGATKTITIAGAGTGDVVGPASATDNALARYDLTTGKLIQNGSITQDDNGNLENTNAISFDLTPGTLPTAAGSLYWDNGVGTETLSLIMDGGTVVQQIGEEIYFRVRASSAIADGDVIMFTGSTGTGNLEAAPATGLDDTTAGYVLGLATEAIANNQYGYVTNFGLVNDVDTSAFAEGDILYMDVAVAGGLTTTIPTAPNAKVQVCTVARSHVSGGVLVVRVSFGGILGQIGGDVEITTPANGDLLIRDQTAGTWLNATLTGGSGITVTNGAGSVSVANDGITGTANGVDNRIATYSAAATLNGEANLTFTGSLLTVTGSAQITTNLEIDGALNHDGTTIGFYGNTPVVQETVAALIGPPDTVANALAITEIINALGDGVAGVGLFTVA